MTNIHDEAARSQGRAQRKGTRDATRVGGHSPRRRFMVVAATAAAGALFAASAAWACTLREGTLEVYRSSYSSCTNAGTECSKVVGTGAQIGLAEVSATGSSIVLNGTGFAASEDFLTTFRRPGSTANCHRTNVDGSVGLLDSGDSTVSSGPSGAFKETRTTPATLFTTVVTGLARICVQQEEFDPPTTVISGQIADVAVVL